MEQPNAGRVVIYTHRWPLYNGFHFTLRSRENTCGRARKLPTFLRGWLSHPESWSALVTAPSLGRQQRPLPCASSARRLPLQARSAHQLGKNPIYPTILGDSFLWCGKLNQPAAGSEKFSGGAKRNRRGWRRCRGESERLASWRNFALKFLFSLPLPRTEFLFGLCFCWFWQLAPYHIGTAGKPSCSASCLGDRLITTVLPTGEGFFSAAAPPRQFCQVYGQCPEDVGIVGELKVCLRSSQFAVCD